MMKYKSHKAYAKVQKNELFSSTGRDSNSEISKPCKLVIPQMLVSYDGIKIYVCDLIMKYCQMFG